MLSIVGAGFDPAVLDAGGILLQSREDVGQPNVSTPARFGWGFLSTLIVGAIMLAFIPDYFDRLVGDIRSSPVSNFGWGFAALIGLVVLIFVLFITVIGILLLIPLLPVVLVVGLVGNALAYTAIYDGVLDNRWAALAVGAVTVGVLNVIPVVGTLIAFVVGSIGLGAIIQDWMR